MLLDAQGRSGADNMAADDALLEEAAASGRAFLRLYRWSPPCLSFGRHEPAATRYDRAAIARLGIDVVRRPTGGRAVWHEHELTYAVAAPVCAFGSAGLRASCRAVHERLAVALRSLGADTRLAANSPTVRLSDGKAGCFASPVGGEVLIGDRKVVGSAQVRRGTAFLQHGSILLGGSQDVVNQVSRSPGAGDRATTLSAALGRPVRFDEVADAVARAWGDFLAPSSPVPLASLGAGSSFFADPAWTWRR